MSWKSFVSAGLLCILASPVMAQAPTLRVVSNPTLNAQGNWVWNVSIEPAGTSVVAAELGFDANRDVVSATKGAAFTGDNTNIAGNVIFGWETAVATGTPPLPEGVHVGTGANADKVFSALGSNSAAGISGQTPYMTIVTTGPTNAALTGDLRVAGRYNADGTLGPTGGTAQGRIAAEVGASSGNFQGYVGTATRTIVNGDINLSGRADDSDFGIFVGQYQPGVDKSGGWTIGDFNRDGRVDDSDFGIFVGSYNPSAPLGGSTTNVNVTGTGPTGAGGGAAVTSVPEPASLALVGLGLLGGLGLFRRKR